MSLEPRHEAPSRHIEPPGSSVPPPGTGFATSVLLPIFTSASGAALPPPSPPAPLSGPSGTPFPSSGGRDGFLVAAPHVRDAAEDLTPVSAEALKLARWDLGEWDIGRSKRFRREGNQAKIFHHDADKDNVFRNRDTIWRSVCLPVLSPDLQVTVALRERLLPYLLAGILPATGLLGPFLASSIANSDSAVPSARWILDALPVR